MLDLETELRDHFRHETTGLDPSPTLDTLVHTRRRRRHRHQNLGAAGVVLAAALALVTGTASLLGRNGDPAEFSTDDGTDATDTLYLAPPSLPPGFAKTGVEDGDPAQMLLAPDLADPWLDGWERQQRWVQFDEAREHPIAAIDIVWGSSRDGFPDQLGPYSYDVRAVTLSDGATGSAARLPGYEAEVRAGLALREGDGLQLDDPPSGFELAGEWPPGHRQLEGLRGNRYEAPDGRSVEVWLYDDAELPIAANYGRSSARLVEVRGHQGVVTPDPLIFPPTYPTGRVGGELFVEWVETSGERVTVAGVGLTEEELLAVADSLEAVDAATWFGLPGGSTPDVALGDDDDITTTTSTTVPPPVAEAEHIEGTYEGTANYHLAEGGPCEVVHEDQITFSLSDGSTWTLDHDQCGQLGEDTWSATGTFTMTAPDGATLTGTTEQRDVPMPTEGQPFELMITGGTGRFDGATGLCTLDNHVTNKQLGSQELNGPFVCDFTP